MELLISLRLEKYERIFQEGYNVQNVLHALHTCCGNVSHVSRVISIDPQGEREFQITISKRSPRLIFFAFPFL